MIGFSMTKQICIALCLMISATPVAAQESDPWLLIDLSGNDYLNPNPGITDWAPMDYDRWDEAYFIPPVDDLDPCPDAADPRLNFSENIGPIGRCYAELTTRRTEFQNQLYFKIRSHLPPKEGNKLRDDQMRWRVRIEPSCQRFLIWEHYEPSSLNDQYNRMQCRLWKVNNRTGWLNATYSALLEAIEAGTASKFGAGKDNLDKCLSYVQAGGAELQQIEDCYNQAIKRTDAKADSAFDQSYLRTDWDDQAKLIATRAQWFADMDKACSAKAKTDMFPNGLDAHLIWLQCHLEWNFKRVYRH
ncbi:MAG: hypothetical protein PVF65_05060 [Sphingomonadales bacterium]|jgi:uncharacterized protein YecT (DUF1311 family)